jgi:hypothetical protein
MDVNAERVDIAVTEREIVTSGEVPTAVPDGPMAAVLLAAGIGAFALGLFTTLAEASAEFRERLVLNAAVGPLSGKTVWATVVFLIAWVVLHVMWRERDRILRPATTAFVVLTLLGLLGTFPIFFQAFAPE